MNIFNKCKQFLSFLILGVFTISMVFPPNSYAQNTVYLPTSGVMLSRSVSFTPAIMAGMIIHPENPFLFDFMIDTGDDNLQGEAFKAESQKLIHYFLATLTVPDDEMWVNLSP